MKVLSDEILLESYKRMLEMNFEEEFLQLVKAEIDRRGLVVD